MANVVGKWNAQRVQRAWQVGARLAHLADDQALQDRNKAAQEAGSQLEYMYRSQYLPEQGMFCQLPDDLRLGSRLSSDVQVPACVYPGGHVESPDGVHYS